MWSRGVEVAPSFQNMRFPGVTPEGVEVAVGKRSSTEKVRERRGHALERDGGSGVGIMATAGEGLHKPGHAVARMRGEVRIYSYERKRPGALLDSEHSQSY